MQQHTVKGQLLERGVSLLDLPVDQVVYRAGVVHSNSDPNRVLTLKELGQESVAAGGGP